MTEHESNKEVLKLATILALAVSLLGYGASQISFKDNDKLPPPVPTLQNIDKLNKEEK